MAASAFRLRPVAPTEADVLRDVRRYLAAHPDVARVIRVNSGAARIQDAKGERFVHFCELDGQAAVRAASRRAQALAEACREHEEAVPDLVGFMHDGRFLALECKRGGWRRPTDDRERAQERFMQRVIAAGGVAGFVTSISDAERILGDRHA